VDVLCTADVAAVHAEPSEDAERVTELLRGEPVAVEERRDGWARIRTAYDYPGWVCEEELAGAGDPVAEARLSRHAVSLARRRPHSAFDAARRRRRRRRRGAGTGTLKENAKANLSPMTTNPN
jgi:SH3-like domain-containing protein